MEEQCKSCRFWVLAKEEQHVESGLCRVSPPVIVPGLGGGGHWPFTKSTDWCGCYKTLKDQAT